MKKLSFSMTVLLVFMGFFLFVPSAEVSANGTETLGPPNITIAQGSGIVAAGTGLATQPGTININVPGDVNQALLYWSCTGTGDNTVTVNGNPVTGTFIGGGTPTGSSFRADITGLVVSGPNVLAINGLACSGTEDGAGALVIFDDGSSVADIEIRDGFDFAFGPSIMPQFQVTVLQTFSFAPVNSSRTGNLTLFVGDAEAGRPDVIEITVDGVTTRLIDTLDGSDGAQWDTENIQVNIPAGVSQVGIQLISEKDPMSGLPNFPDSLTWVVGALSISSGVILPGGEGCTPGYWKQSQHFDSWTAPYTPSTLFSSVFENAFPGKTLLQVLQLGGGGLNALGRHTVAALLNAASSGVDYDLSVSEVISLFNNLFPSTKTNYNELKDNFETFNEQGCPLN